MPAAMQEPGLQNPGRRAAESSVFGTIETNAQREEPS